MQRLKMPGLIPAIMASRQGGLWGVVALGLAACAPTVPDSGAGVGFGDYSTYRAGDILPSRENGALPTSDEELTPAPETRVVTGPAVAAGTEGATEVSEAGLGSTAGPLLTLNNPGISSEQDFDAVSAERDIAADAERLRAARQQYQLVTPTELQRPGEEAPNIIDYALATSHPIGVKKYRRSPFGASRVAEKCAGYRTADVAQEEFLSAGGPDRDRLGLDPDGDGYACDWNPATYRSLVRD